MCKNYPEKAYFNYSEYAKLFQVISEGRSEFASEDLEAVDDAVTQCRRYVEVVDSTEQAIKLAGVRFDDDVAKFQELVTRYDTQHRNAHEAAIASVNMLNSMSEIYGCQKIYNGSESRYEVADFCLEVVVAIFENRRK